MPSRLRARLTTARLRALRLFVAGASTVAVVSLPSSATAAPEASGADAQGLDQQVLFKASQDPGYACFRIPAVVRTNDGTLLAFAEGRTNDCSDAGDIDIVVKRSEDGGRTWSGLKVVNAGAGDTHGNPAPVVDRRTGRILLAETWNTGKPGGGNCDVPCDRRPHLQYSDDDGKTWSAPRDLSDEILPESWNSWYATGPVHGIQLTKGAHAGRLVFGVNAESYAGGRVTENHAALVVSDDGGKSWRVGAKDSYPIAADGTFRQKPSELTLEENSDGTVYVSGREQDGTDLGHRTHALSRDGGDSFARPFESIPDMYTPQVQAACLRVGDRMLLAAPADPDRRRTMMIRSSYDGGRTWESVDRGTVVSTDWAGYSDLVQIGSGSVGLMYEGGAVDARDEIRFARFGIDWLGDRRGPDDTTSDQSPHSERATVLGDPAETPGRYGGAVQFDGRDDAVRLPYRDELPLGTRDFTTSMWFRYSATTGEQPLLWMGGIGTNQPQVWLRAEPALNRITGLITTRSGATPPMTAWVRDAKAYNDGKWHHIALRRGGGKLTMFLDGTQVSSADVPGSVTRNSPFGVHVGQRLDSRAHFNGAIDEVRVYARALSDAEVRSVADSNANLVGWPLVRLPLDDVTSRPANTVPGRPAPH
ncbi:exo-alpha-sialidase [Streptomyces sp. NA04227]|uniref:sialidase family protein n=1 Tax=Streptomyces sp. NA04227 TaxID=2742136 RepID=UPI0015928B9A|nr:sialidase family protein [Streptomyces sp. NA04227]QKW10175.1 exo-alpha-sialidase [Streptomyces sp. NA04227]